MAEDAQTPVPRSPRWMRIVLGLSLALNLVVVGIVGGALLRFGGPAGFLPPSVSLGAAMYRELPKEERRAIVAETRKSTSARPMRRGKEAEALAAALRAEPFDPAAVQQVLSGQVEARRDWHQSMQAAWLTRVTEMSAEDRRAYADRGYRGHGIKRDGLDITLSHTRGITSPTIRREMRRRNGIVALTWKTEPLSGSDCE